MSGPAFGLTWRQRHGSRHRDADSSFTVVLHWETWLRLCASARMEMGLSFGRPAACGSLAFFHVLVVLEGGPLQLPGTGILR